MYSIYSHIFYYEQIATQTQDYIAFQRPGEQTSQLVLQARLKDLHNKGTFCSLWIRFYHR